jgi:hypothetical protein
MNPAILVDTDFSRTFRENLKIDLRTACGQIVRTPDARDGAAHLLWSRSACPEDGSIMASDQVDFDFLTTFVSANTADISAHPVLGGIARGLLNLFGQGATRFGFVFDVSEPNQAIGYWVEDASESPSSLVLYALCTDHPLLSAISSQYRFASTCTPVVADQAMTSITFANPTPVDTSSVEVPDDERDSIADGSADYTDYDRSANVTYRAQPYRSLGFTDRIARAVRVSAAVRLITGDVPGYYASQRNADIWQRNYRDAARHEILRQVSTALSRRR